MGLADGRFYFSLFYWHVSGVPSSGSNYDPAIELEYWKIVKDSNDNDLLQNYLDEYPNGKFAPLARLKIKKLLSSE